MKPHLLYIAFWYPPSRASGVYRALATTKAFVDEGWDVTVITTTEKFLEEEIGSTDPSLLDLIPRSVNILRVPFTFDHSSPGADVREMNWLRGNFPLVWQFWFRKTRRFREALSIIAGRSPRSFPIADNYVTWIEPAIHVARKSHAKNPFSKVLATGNPFSAFEVARVVANFSGVPFIVDYRDPWTIDVFTEEDANLPPSTIASERLIIDEAAACVHVNEAIANAYAARYPEAASKFKVVINGFDESSIGEPKHVEIGDPLRFGMLGTVNDRWPLEPIFDGWIKAKSDLPPNSQLVLGGHLGYFARSDSSLRALLPDEELGFEYVGPIPKGEVAAFYSSLSSVVVPAPGGAMVTSGKVFEAAALGMPVICVQAAQGGARKVLADHPFAFGAEPDAEAIAHAFRAAAEAAIAITPKEIANVRARMAKFSRTKTINRMVQVVFEAGITQ